MSSSPNRRAGSPLRKAAAVRLASLALALASFVTTNDSSALEPPLQPGRSKIMGGVALLVSGAMITGIGAGVYVANENAAHASCVPCAEKGWIFPTVLMSIGGAVFLSGVPLLVLGTVENSRASSPATATLFLGPMSASARLTF
jgi:hypothetical protein